MWVRAQGPIKYDGWFLYSKYLAMKDCSHHKLLNGRKIRKKSFKSKKSDLNHKNLILIKKIMIFEFFNKNHDFFVPC